MESKYDVIIGLEIHVQTKTNSKMFCSCSSTYFQDEPNTHVCPVCFGLPGALPVPNKVAIEKCILLGLATNCDIDNEIHFDRKHYFYPDLPKGYQISQYGRPICSNGSVMIKDENGNDVKIEIERIHQEEDVAKSTHHKEGNMDYSLIDYNKSGVALIEIVTKPCIRSAHDAKAYASVIKQLCIDYGISDTDMEKGQMRCEPNISLQEKGKWKQEGREILPIGDYKLNSKVEVKNIGSISAVEKSIEFEIKRIADEYKKGNTVEQQTRGWNADKNVTEFQRSKETSDDYRYMPEPDIPVIDITKEDIDEIEAKFNSIKTKIKKKEKIKDEKTERYQNDYGLNEYQSQEITRDVLTPEYFERWNKDLLETDQKNSDPVFQDYGATGPEVASFIMGPVKSYINATGEDIKNIADSISSGASQLMIDKKKGIITRAKFQEIFNKALEEKKDPGDLLDEFKKTKEESNSNLEDTVSNVIDENQNAVDDFKKGKKESLGYLLGQVMQKTHGSADPNEVRSILEKKLNE